MSGWRGPAALLRAACVILAAFFAARPARAEPLPVVVVLVADADRDAPLVEALRIQLAGRAFVRERPEEAPGTSLSQRIDAAARALTIEGAKLAVWVERPAPNAPPTPALLHLVGDREGRALVVEQRVEAGAELDFDRALALKVAEVFDAIVTEPPERALPWQLSSAAGEPRRASPKRDDRPPPRSEVADEVVVRFVGDVGGWGATGTGTAPAQGGVLLGAGGRLAFGAFVGEAAAQGRVVTSLGHEVDSASVDASEGAVGAAVRLAGAWEVVAFGGEIGLGGRIVSAMGETSAGRKGDGETVVPYLSLLPQATFTIASFLELRASVGVEVALRRHRFLVNEEPILDLGTVRGVASGSFVFAAP